MTLERCPTCKKMISVEAHSCPKCGQPLDDDWREKAKEEKKPSRMWKYVVPVTLVLTAWTIWDQNKPEPSYVVTAAEYGEQWGFTANELRVTCRHHQYDGGSIRPHVLVEAGGKTYALNGAAMGSGLYPSAREIMKKDKDGLYTFKGQTEVLKRGVSMCR